MALLFVPRLKLGVEVRSHGHELDQVLGIAPRGVAGAVRCGESRRPVEVAGGAVEAVRQNRVLLTAPEASVRPVCKCPILRSLTDAADAGVIGT